MFIMVVLDLYSQLPDTDEDSDLPEQRSATPMFVKRIAEKSDNVSTTTEEAGQPSPVSVLDSPFHDEACTTSESNLTGIKPSKSLSLPDVSSTLKSGLKL